MGVQGHHRSHGHRHGGEFGLFEAGRFHRHVVGSGRKGGKTVQAGARSLGRTLAAGCRLCCGNFGSGDQRAGGVGHGAIDGGAAALLGYRCHRTQ